MPAWRVCCLGVLSIWVSQFLTGCSVANKQQSHQEARVIEFAGYEWQVKHRSERAGPGNNFFSAEANNVWVDDQGYLHLKMIYRDGHWYCAEIISRTSFGYGNYFFTLAPLARPLDKNIVLGLFLWDSYARHHNHEVDIEFSAWGQQQPLNVQYVVQPEYAPGNKHRFRFDLQAGASQHSFNWSENKLVFASCLDTIKNIPPARPERITWQRLGAAVPRAARENIRINLWLYRGMPPANGQETEVVITNFIFTPLQESSK